MLQREGKQCKFWEWIDYPPSENGNLISDGNVDSSVQHEIAAIKEDVQALKKEVKELKKKKGRGHKISISCSLL